MPHLRNRLAVAVCHDLAANAPKSYNALKNWLTHCGFWLADLEQCKKTPDQTSFMIGLLALALIQEHTDYSLPQACELIRQYYWLHKTLLEVEA